MAKLRAIDFYFLNLSQLRQALIEAFRHYVAEAPPVPRSRTMRLLDRYEEIVGHQEVERLRRLAERLAGKRIVHVNSTRTGGGVAEILGWMVPLMEELGIDARWEVIAGPPDFYRVTKAFHNGLQGLPVSLRKSDFDLHYEVNRENAQRLNLEADIVFVHDPQPIYLPQFTPPGQVGRWIWRCHIDASHPNRAIWKYLETGDFALRRGDLLDGRLRAAAGLPDVPHPAFDRSAVGQELRRFPRRSGWRRLARLGIDPERPLLLQVSRFDRFKDPLGVIEAYRLLKPYYPEMQLALAGGPADDDPEGAEVLREVLDRAGRRRQPEGSDASARRPPHHQCPAALGDRGAAKVAQGRFWADRDRSPLEGQAGDRRRLRRHHLAGPRLSDRVSSCIPRPGPPTASATCCAMPTSGSAWARPATSSYASISC